MAEDLPFAPATVLADRIRRGHLSPVDVVDACLSRIEDHDDEINAFRVLFADEARERAREAEAAVEAGSVAGPLHGVPVAIKDNADVAGESTPAGLAPLLDRPVERDSVAVARLREAGAIILGKTHMPELGSGTTDTSWGEPTSTPFDPARNSGGSSGGSAAAVASGFVPLALGTDGGGSIRIPASWSGVYGIKPTFRRVPRLSRRPDDAFARVRPFSEFGPLARTVEDAALMLSVMAGTHPRDPFAGSPDDADFTDAVGDSIEGATVAYSPDLGGFPVEERVSAIAGEAVRRLESAGATVEEVDLDLGADHATLTETWMGWLAVGRAQQAERLAEAGIDVFGAHRDAVHPGFREAVERGRSVSAVEHGLTARLRTAVTNALVDCFESADLLVSPTLAVPPVENEADGYTLGPTEVGGEAVDPHLGWCLTHPFNFSGHPAASVPAGLTDDGLPVGLQVAGPRFADDAVLAASVALERIAPWAGWYPSLL